MQIFAAMLTTAELSLINIDPDADFDDIDALYSSLCSSKLWSLQRVKLGDTILKWGNTLKSL